MKALKQVTLFLKLAWVCTRLLLNLLFFCWQLLWLRLNKRILLYLTITLITAANLLVSVLIWQHKHTPITNIVQESPHLNSQLNQLYPNTTRLVYITNPTTIITNHQLLEKKGMTNQAIYINLSKLFAFSDHRQAAEYLEKATRITPWLVQ